LAAQLHVVHAKAGVGDFVVESDWHVLIGEGLIIATFSGA
jgi:hypothetical protein